MESQPETQLSYKLRKLTDGQRDALLADLGISERTWFNWLKRPGALVGADALVTIKEHLDRIDGRDYNLVELMKPVVINA